MIDKRGGTRGGKNPRKISQVKGCGRGEGQKGEKFGKNIKKKQSENKGW